MRAVGAVDQALVHCSSRSGGWPCRGFRQPPQGYYGGQGGHGHQVWPSKSSSSRPSPANAPELISKGTKVAAAEAAVTAFEAIAAADLEEASRLATEFEALGGGALIMVLARTRAAPRVGGLLNQSRGNIDGPHGRCRRGG
jgi:hypothetical protein